MELYTQSIKEIHKGLINKEFSAFEIAKDFLGKIKKEDKKINSFISITEDLALNQAKKIDEILASGKEVSVLAGIPAAIKDNILVKGEKCTAASKILENYTASYSATCVKKLAEKGVVILGKTNLDEFAMGSSTENSAFGATKNPIDLARVPGGSSGGSAAAVVANFCPFALGSDTGGSIRLPASFCGAVGLKPTYGAVSRFGLIAFASSLDQIGPIAKTAEDIEIIFDAISGKDELDSTSASFENKNQKVEIKNLTIGIPKEYFIGGIDKEVEQIIKNAIKKFEDSGARIEEISLPGTKYAVAVYYLIAVSEASANLARFDGIKYGLSKKAKDLIDVYFETRNFGFGKEVKRRIVLGTYALSAGYYDAYYLKAQKARTLIAEDFHRSFEKVDAIFSPVSPTPAFKIGEKIGDPLLMYLSDIFTVSANLAGLPAISIPAGATSGNLPVGLQIMGKPFEDKKILEIGKIFENIRK